MGCQRGLDDTVDRRILKGMTATEVKQIRQAAGLTQEELAQYLGLRHRSQVHHLETGRTAATGAKGRLLEQLRAAAGRGEKKLP